MPWYGVTTCGALTCAEPPPAVVVEGTLPIDGYMEVFGPAYGPDGKLLPEFGGPEPLADAA